MPDDTNASAIDEVEARRLAEEAVLKRVTLAEHSRLTSIIGQMQTNLDRMVREGTTTSPALDSRSDENIAPASAREGEFAVVTIGGTERKVKTQYIIDKGIQADHQSQLDTLLAENSRFFIVEESIMDI